MLAKGFWATCDTGIGGHLESSNHAVERRAGPRLARHRSADMRELEVDWVGCAYRSEFGAL